MIRRATLGIAACVVALTGCNGIGAYRPWAAHVTAAPKPGSPIRAPEGKALVLVVQAKPPGSGNGAYTVFANRVPVAQFEPETASWTSSVLEPGEQHFYVRTWTSEFCVRVDAQLAAGKVYVLGLNPEDAKSAPLAGTNPNIFASAAFRDSPAAGALAYFPYVALDVDAARKELKEHETQVADCMGHADSVFGQPKAPAMPTIGFDEIDLSPPKQASAAIERK
jgi:hypothetical protein